MMNLFQSIIFGAACFIPFCYIQGMEYQHGSPITKNKAITTNNIYLRSTANSNKRSRTIISKHHGRHHHKDHRDGNDGHDGRDDNKSSSFDFYVLSMSYQPEFCHQHRQQGFVGCETPMQAWKKNPLTLHGLWPEDNNGSWPSNCSNEKFNHETVQTLGRGRFNTYWPNIKTSPSSTSDTYYSFWTHEWEKHGTCTGLGQIEYFNMTLNHFLPTPSIVSEHYGKSISKTQLIEAFKQENVLDVVVVCAGGGKFLSEVRTCVGKKSDSSNEPGDDVKCIIQVEEEGNCNDEIMLTKFYSDDYEITLSES